MLLASDVFFGAGFTGGKGGVAASILKLLWLHDQGSILTLVMLQTHSAYISRLMPFSLRTGIVQIVLC